MLPESLIRTIIDHYGETGAEWLERLPETIRTYEEHWSLTVSRPFPDLSYHYVTRAVQADGTEVVLKLGVPDRDIRMQVEALRAFDGDGCVKLLDADVESGATLLESLRPGEMLSEQRNDEEAVSVAAALLRRLWREPPPGHDFPTLWEWSAALRRVRDRIGDTTNLLPASLVERASDMLVELTEATEEPVLLHGDLHHYNILSATRDPWLAIDPKGIVGAAEFDVCAFLRNELMSQAEPGRVLARRLDQFAEELGFERERIAGWGLIDGMLSASWHYEDHGQLSESDREYVRLAEGAT